MEPISEKNFTIVDTNGMCTLAFLVNEPEEGTSYCTIQKLDCTYPNPLDTNKKTFYIRDDGVNEDKSIVLLTVGHDKALLNLALLSTDDKLYVSKKPSNVNFKILFSEENNEFKDLKYTPNFRRPISIIDPEIPDEVKPVLYFDEEANMVKSKVRLQSNKSYIALEIKEIEE